MKNTKFLATLIFCIIISFYGCKDTPKTEKQDTSKSSKVLDSTTSQKVTTPNPASAKPVTAEPAQNAEGVWHYTCKIGCPGGAGSATNCSNCKNRLVHNTAYHSSPSSVADSAPFANQPTTPEPAQNAAGVWHYTCAKGCAGGAGAVTTCKTCGGTLAHNQGYH